MMRDEAQERACMEKSEEPSVMSTFLEELGLTKDDIKWDAEWSTL